MAGDFKISDLVPSTYFLQHRVHLMNSPVGLSTGHQIVKCPRLWGHVIQTTTDALLVPLLMSVCDRCLMSHVFNIVVSLAVQIFVTLLHVFLFNVLCKVKY